MLQKCYTCSHLCSFGNPLHHWLNCITAWPVLGLNLRVYLRKLLLKLMVPCQIRAYVTAARTVRDAQARISLNVLLNAFMETTVRRSKIVLPWPGLSKFLHLVQDSASLSCVYLLHFTWLDLLALQKYCSQNIFLWLGLHRSLWIFGFMLLTTVLGGLSSALLLCQFSEKTFKKGAIFYLIRKLFLVIVNMSLL